jgi:uncharacterized protein (TIGR00730 family)
MSTVMAALCCSTKGFIIGVPLSALRGRSAADPYGSMDPPGRGYEGRPSGIGEVGMRRLCVFCGSNVGGPAVYADAARRFGEQMVARGLELVFGAGHVGLMGVLADAVLAAGGVAVGVIPQALVDKELAHTGLTALHVVETMHQRKALMADLSDGFAALPGGYGTCDELFEILTWAQLGLHSKPIGLLNVAAFFTPLLAWLDHTVGEGFVRPAHRRLLLDADEPAALLDALLRFRPEAGKPKWIDREER